MSALFLQVLAVSASAVIVWRAEPAINRMRKETPAMIRLAFLLLTLGGVGEIIWIVMGDLPSFPTVIALCGVAALLFCERRVRVLCPPARSQQ